MSPTAGHLLGWSEFPGLINEPELGQVDNPGLAVMECSGRGKLGRNDNLPALVDVAELVIHHHSGQVLGERVCGLKRRFDDEISLRVDVTPLRIHPIAALGWSHPAGKIATIEEHPANSPFAGFVDVTTGGWLERYEVANTSHRKTFVELFRNVKLCRDDECALLVNESHFCLERLAKSGRR